jgi:hypothetical protein
MSDNPNAEILAKAAEGAVNMIQGLTMLVVTLLVLAALLVLAVIGLLIYIIWW